MSLWNLVSWLASSLAMFSITAITYAIVVRRSWRISQWAIRSLRHISATATGVWRKTGLGVQIALATRRRRFSACLAVVIVATVAWLTLGVFSGQSTSAMVIVDQPAAAGMPIDASSLDVDQRDNIAQQAVKSRAHQGLWVLACAGIVGVVWTVLSCRVGRR